MDFTAFKNIFWDIDPAKLSLESHKTFIIERVLERGTAESLSALFESYSKDEVCAVIKSSSRLSRRTANFWKIYLDIQEPIKCLEAQLPNPLSERWH